MNLLATLPSRPPGGANSFVYSKVVGPSSVAGEFVADAGAGMGGPLAVPLGPLGRAQVDQRPVNVERHATHVEDLLHRRASAQRPARDVPDRR